MFRTEKILTLLFILNVLLFLSGCGGGASSMSTSGSGSSGTSSGGSGSGSGSSKTVPGYGEGIGSSGQTSAAKFLYVNPLPGGGPYAAAIQSNGALTLQTAGGATNLNPMTMAIDPSGSYIYQTASGYNSGTMGGVFVYQIDRTTGGLGQAVASNLLNSQLFSDIVDNTGKFLYVQSTNGIYAFSIQSGGGLAQITGSPFAAPAPSSPGYSQPASLMMIDQTNSFLYVSTSGGIVGFNINQSTGQLTPISGSPFGTNVTSPWTIVITPNNAFLYELQAQNSANLYGYSIDQSSGALTPISGSPFTTGTCGSMVPSGTIGIPGPDNMTIASAGKFMYDNCGIYSLDAATGAVSQVSSSGPGDWPVIDPTGDFLWAIASDQQSCFHCDAGIQSYQVDPNTGMLTAIPNAFLFLTNSEVGSINSVAITK